MEPIQNSTIKEQMRVRNESEARTRESEIYAKYTEKIRSMVPLKKYEISSFVVIGIIVGIVFWIASSFIGFLIGFFGTIGAGYLLNNNVNTANRNQEKQKQELMEQAKREIAEEYRKADLKTQQEIAAYDAGVKNYCNKILNNAENISDMVEHQLKMFDRSISHADHGSHMRFVEANLIYTVQTYGITYSFDSRYTNSMDNFDFKKKRFRDLNTPEECEGLAKALAKMTIMGMKKKYPANSMNITVSHNDANVTLHYRGANKDFIPARDIV